MGLKVTIKAREPQMCGGGRRTSVSQAWASGYASRGRSQVAFNEKRNEPRRFLIG